MDELEVNITTKGTGSPPPTASSYLDCLEYIVSINTGLRN
jgi:hypothetical protein